MNPDPLSTNLFSTKLYEEDDECYLPLFNKYAHECPLVQKAISYINHMIELNYIKYDPSELNFTTAGIEYMFQQQRDFMNNTMDKMDFSSFPLAYNLVKQLKEADGVRQLEEFPSNKNGEDKFASLKLKRTQLYSDCMEDPDYNVINFSKKSDDCDDPQG